MSEKKVSEDQKELILDFVSEIREMLDNVEPTLLNLDKLEDSNEIQEVIDNSLRLFHSMKGGASLLGFKQIADGTHAVESFLQHFKKKPEDLNPEYIDILINSCDLNREILEHIEEHFSDTEYQENIKQHIQKLEYSLKNIGQKKPLFDLPQSNKKSTSKETDHPNTNIPNERIESFVSNCLDDLESAEGSTLVLDKIPDDVDVHEYLESIFRRFHSIKGNAGFLGIKWIERLAHRVEALLEGMLEEKIALKGIGTEFLLETIDIVKEAVINISHNQEINTEKFEQVEKKLGELLSQESPLLIGNIMKELDIVSEQDIQEALGQQNSSIGNILLHAGKVSETDVEKALKVQAERKKKVNNIKNVDRKAKDIRVSLNKLDELINLVGELVISESMIAHHPALENPEFRDLKSMSHQLNRYIRDLQEISMSMRMIPLEQLFHKMNRVVRDTSKKIGKNVDFMMKGEQTEVDKTLVEQVADPLLHIVRNAVDHGLETPEERKKTGKSDSGNITLEAKQVGNEVWIIVNDDGKGLDREKILQKAIDRELVAKNNHLSDEEVWKLIFEPGFSTAQAVTDLSGRGVGMDVVKKNIEKLRGRVDIYSELGKGSTFTLRIPLTLTIVDGLLIRVGDAFYALPTGTVRETLRPHSDQITKTLDNIEMIRVRENMLPILKLNQIYSLESNIEKLEDGIVLILREGEQSFCLFVDEVIGQQQVVVKSVPDIMSKVPHLSGCTILGDGQVGLILDATSLSNVLISN